MAAHQNRTTDLHRTGGAAGQAAAAQAAAPPPAARAAGQVSAIINVAGDLQLDESNAFVTIAHKQLTLTDGGGGALLVAGDDFQLTNGGAATIVAGRDFTLRNGGCGFALAGRDLAFVNGESGAGVAVGRATATGHQSAVIAARDVTLHQSSAGLIVAGAVTLEGKATVVVEITPERVAGALVGLLFYLPVRLLQKLQGQ